MYRLPIALGFGLLSVFGLASLGTPQQPGNLPLNQAVVDNAIDVQLRGPLHEAFAQPFDGNQEPGEVVPKQPPPPVPEDPPEQRPESADAQWIPGYWAWDSEREDFVWISGVYRVPPQGRTFIPGYWEQSTAGWRWVSGFWSNDSQPDITYTPEPPAPLEVGPSMPQPDDESMYIPGTWLYRDSRFVWRPGYYAAVQPGQVWVPSRYLWTPRGYAFVDSYWDAPFEDRGLIFAPVCFNQPLWANPGWRFRPNFVVNFDLFFGSAFRHGRGGHYHYGNYHDGRYAGRGYRPWYSGAGRYDPTFAYHGWQNRRSQPNWVANQQQIYANRTAGRAAVPPTTLAQQTVIVNSKNGSPVVTPIQQFNNDRVRVVTATAQQQKVQQANVQQVREIAKNRQNVETVALNKSNAKTPRPIASTVDRSTILGPNAKTIAPNVQTPGKSGPKSAAPAPAVKTTPVPQKATAPAAKQTPPAPAKKATPAPVPQKSPATKQTPPAPTKKATPAPVPQKAPATKQAPPAPEKKATPAPVPQKAPATKQAAPAPEKKATPAPVPQKAPATKQAAPLPTKKAAAPAAKQAAPLPAKKAAAPAAKQAAPARKTPAPAVKQAAPVRKAPPPAAKQAAPVRKAAPAPVRQAPAAARPAAPVRKATPAPAKRTATPTKKKAEVENLLPSVATNLAAPQWQATAFLENMAVQSITAFRKA